MRFVQYVLDALSLGSTFALAALGIALVFSLMRLINFAHGEIIVASAYALWYLRSEWELHWFLATIGTVSVGIAVALIMERLAFRPLRHAGPTMLLASSFAVSVTVQNFLILSIGDDFRSVASPSFITGTVTWGSLRLPKVSILALVVSVLFMTGLALFLRRTRLGQQMLASAEDFDMARLLGVRANGVIAAAFAISGLLAAVLALILVAQQGLIHIRMGLPPLLIAFVATVIGGIGSLPGAVAGGLILGGVVTALQVALPIGLLPFRDAFTYSIVIVILLVKPEGLFGSRTRESRV
ncbi:MAG: branched-chain amino acid ABC transporter permease [Actinobacteria bacterium]|nr:branched-chain amino acid ABC transporter permease [Actinomycetota bacterium]